MVVVEQGDQLRSGPSCILLGVSLKRTEYFSMFTVCFLSNLASTFRYQAWQMIIACEITGATSDCHFISPNEAAIPEEGQVPLSAKAAADTALLWLCRNHPGHSASTQTLASPLPFLSSTSS